MKIHRVLLNLLCCGMLLLTPTIQAAEGDGTGGGGGDGTLPGPDAPPGAQDAEGPGTGIGPISMTKPKLDQLFTWAEETFPEYFPENQESFEIESYYVRYYPTTDIYLGASEGLVYVLGEPFGGLLMIGKFKTLVQFSGI